MRIILSLLCSFLFFASCSVSKKLERSAKENVLNAGVLKTAHVGISVYEPATGKTWYDYQGDHYFVPASNTKLPTCYAAMKYLGDSLVGLRYNVYGNTKRKMFVVQPSGDPTFLHPEFKNQPVVSFFSQDTFSYYMVVGAGWQEKSLGPGWSWSDFDESYMAERSLFPIYGNVVRFLGNDNTVKVHPPKVEIEFGGAGDDISPFNFNSLYYKITRKKDQNVFLWDYSNTPLLAIDIPFITSLGQSIRWAKDTIKRLKMYIDNEPAAKQSIVIHSQPTDSLLRPMMHRSDNFFAEQTLLMVSNEFLGFMNDEKIIDTLLKTDLKDLPQKPRWVDGSGLSRYNLFTPQDFVFLLNKMKNEFGMPRLKNIFATGGEGTLNNYYVAEKDFLYAKTGTLSGVVALSGFLETRKGRQLIFSVQVNNHNGSATEVRRAVEKFVEGIRNDH